ncbi:transcription cofactor vestigial-like protein 3 [Hoplias malabaricus]|uniref:transcription cofactor vestigial-like protein 3 n=1 Tax=Hoplias malabaricus TaxID=27720 RepID=UPI0034625A0E
MSCLDVMYHQNYGAHHYLPATSVAAAAAYKAAYYHHHHHHHHTHQQQQKKFSVYSKMQGSLDLPGQCSQSKQSEKSSAESELRREVQQDSLEEETRCKEPQPAEAEYLSARCVLFTYFRGDIGDVVDEHFSRALSQPSAFTNDTKDRHGPSTQWKDGGSVNDGQCGSLPSSLWSSSYPSQALSSVHAEFPTTAFHPADSAIWSSHSLTQPGLPPPSALTESWPYGLASQSGAGYPHVHEMYTHMHTRHPHPHTHPMLHHTHSTALDPRFSPLLLPGMRPSCSPSSAAEGVKTELEPNCSTASNWPVSFQGSVDIFDTALEQDKAKSSVWF